MPDKPKVLIIDDEKDNLDLLNRVMRKDYQVYAAISGEEALKLLEDHDFNLMLSDQRMPGMLGTEFFHESVKRQPAAIRVLITGYSDIDSVIDAINKGAVHRFIKKPWKKEELLREINTTVQLQGLITENQNLVKTLRETNTRLIEQEKLLAKDLDERSKLLYQVNQELRELNEKLKGQSLRDGLTGLYNHRAFQQRMHEELARTKRNDSSLSLIFIDVDHFKKFNDTHGHAAGDKILKAVGRHLAASSHEGEGGVRESDVVARYGGEEFAVILPDTPLEGGLIKAERIRKSIAGQKLEGMETQPLGMITVSAGVASFPPDAQSAKDLIDCADQAMYASKQSGRNCVTAYRDIDNEVEAK